MRVSEKIYNQIAPNRLPYSLTDSEKLKMAELTILELKENSDENLISKINCLRKVLFDTNPVDNVREVQELAKGKLAELINKL